MNKVEEKHRCEVPEYVPVCEECWEAVYWDDDTKRFIHYNTELEPDEVSEDA